MPLSSFVVYLIVCPFQRNLQDNDGREAEGRVEGHLCVMSNPDRSLKIFDDQKCVCAIKPVDRSPVTACCVVSWDVQTAPRPHVRNQFITGGWF